MKGLGSETIGLILFKNIFTIAPEVLQLFAFRSSKDIYNSPELKKHAAMVVDAIGAAIDNLNDI